MLKSDIYPIATGEYDTMDTSVSQRVQALINDYVLGDLIKLPKQNRHLGSVLYFAVMAGKCLMVHYSDILSEYLDLAHYFMSIICRRLHWESCRS